MKDEKPHRLTSTPHQWEKLKPLARTMRHEPTRAEALLWEALRNRRLAGARFRRQHAIDGFIADFVCIDAELVIEVDGSVHDDSDQRDYDAQRQRWIESRGFSVLRFRNHEVENDLDTVLDVIRTWFASRTTRTGTT